MKESNALTLLQDGEFCRVVMQDGQVHDVCWSRANHCFFYLRRGTPVVCPAEGIVEWWPAWTMIE